MRLSAARRVSLIALMAAAVLTGHAAMAAPTVWGPYNGDFTAAGDGLKKDARQGDLYAAGDTAAKAFTLSAWVKPSELTNDKTLIAGAGDASGWFLAAVRGRLAFEAPGLEVTTQAPLPVGTWTLVTVTGDGASVKLYANGKLVGQQKAVLTTAPANSLALAPRALGQAAYAGKIAGLTVSNAALDDKAVKAQATTPPHDDLIQFETGSPTWAIQVRQMYGQETPQDAWTLPTSATPPQAPVAKPAYAGPVLEAGPDHTAVIKTWFLQAAPKVSAKPETISSPGFDVASWYQATTPGTVLTTLVDRGVYPDPAYGLNNLAIPENLNKQDYWYRSAFPLPAGYKTGDHLFVTFKGINYAAEVWINGRKLGGITGAFIRGDFDLSPYIKTSGDNVIAVRVTPPPHPGIAEEESLAAGPGNNGGAQAQDGPTFVATEGWDWIPSVRDRNTGLWQDVVLKTTGDVRLGDPQVITALPKIPGRPDNAEADITIHVPVTNLSDHPIDVRIQGAIAQKDGGKEPIMVAQDVTLAPGDSTVTFLPQDFGVLKIQDPQLWWPNGYGAPALQVLSLKAFAGNDISDTSETRFGIREVTYELSLIDSTGHLDRVEANYTKGRELGIRLTDGTHTGVHRIADLYGTKDGSWATSLTPQAEHSAAITPISDTRLTPYLVIKVNGVRIAVRGGSWGMDDFMKRVDRAHLEPYFRLHQLANVDMIRNWVGQNTEDSFYDLADEYGLMVFNDFWASTQNYQLEPQDVPLFMANATDVVKRYRNHPSIVMWVGRNEGIPQPVLNSALENLIYKEDGTRWYTGSSNQVNLQNSGPYSYKTPEDYFDKLDRGFAPEVGTASFPTLESFQSTTAKSEQWPISDSWAYHDWHSDDGNGSTKPFVAILTTEFGAPTSLADFDRKAQMLNLESHRAIFEGMNANLWNTTSGRLLWMTQPAWPSTQWQILSHDYDTQASFYGVKSAGEPVHVQMNLPDRKVIVVNNLPAALAGANVAVTVCDLAGKTLIDSRQTVDVAGVALSAPLDFGIAKAVDDHRVVIVRLVLTDAAGKALSRNVYWQAASDAELQGLDSLPNQNVAVTAQKTASGLSVTLTNGSTTATLENKLTLLDDKGNRILPAYYSDNYISLMPGERRTVTIDYSSAAKPVVALRGWNTAPQTVDVP